VLNRLQFRLKQWDPVRSQKMWIIGTFISGPLSHCWQMFIEQRVPGAALRQILLKTALNAGFALIISLPVMFTASTLLDRPRMRKDGHVRRATLGDALEKIRADLWQTFLSGTLFWPAANIVVFKFVRVESRAVANSIIAVIWNVYLSGKVNKVATEVQVAGRAPVQQDKT
jgi:hypothetical protein